MFDRSPHVKPETVLHIATNVGVRRFDLETLIITDVTRPNAINAFGVDSTTSGRLIVSCWQSDAVFVVDPRVDASRDGNFEMLAGAGKHGFADGVGREAKFFGIIDLVVVDSERCAYLADSMNQRIRRIELPPHLF